MEEDVENRETCCVASAFDAKLKRKKKVLNIMLTAAVLPRVWATSHAGTNTSEMNFKYLKSENREKSYYDKAKLICLTILQKP